ncbi:MAG: phage integrase N-terminal SAM-like domain-containing protein [Candidatus Omnitrophica bacterium]|nr:phage integrase N-terminal SAM-like domain-containing protein [Candidatus Omnitrophota bacterium]
MRRWFAESRKGGWKYKVKGMARETAGRNFSLHRLGNNQWKVSGYDSEGKQRRYRLVAESIDEAIECSESILGFIPPAAPDLLTPDVVFSRWLESLAVKDKTFKDYKNYIALFLAWVEKRRDINLFSDMRLEHLQSYANDLVRGGYSQNTIRLYLVAIKAAARWASINWEGQINDAGKGFKLPRLPHSQYEIQESPAFSILEICRFLQYLETAEGGSKVLLGVALQALAGLRETEVLRLTRDKLDRDLLTVEGEVKNKPSIRRIPLPALLLDYIAEYQDGDRFTTYRHYTAYSKVVTAHMEEWQRQCPGIGRRLPARELRRTIPTELKAKGLHGWVTERYLGHSAKTITDKHYVSLPEGKLLDLMRIQVVRPINRILRSIRTTLRQNKHEKSTVDKLIVLNEHRNCS